MTVPFWTIVTERDERGGEMAHGLPLLSVSQTRGIVRRSELADDFAAPGDLYGYKVVRRGDVVLNRMSAYKGAVGSAKVDGLVSPDYMVMRPNRGNSSEYVAYLIKSHWFVSEMTSRLRGIGTVDSTGVRTPRIAYHDLGRIRVPQRNAQAQERLVAILDEESGAVKSFVAEQTAFIDLLRERERAVISSTLNLDDGKAGFQPVRVGDVAQLISGFPFPSEGFATTGRPLVRIRDLGGTEASIRFDGSNFPPDVVVTHQDLLIGMDGDFNVGRWRGVEPGLLNQRLLAIRSSDSLLLRWLELAMPLYLRFINDLTYSTTVKHLSVKQVRGIKINIPVHRDRMAEIIRQVDRDLSELNEAIEDAESAIGLTEERFVALASEVLMNEVDAYKRKV